MADITMCANAERIDCPLRMKCYRHRAIKDKNQNYKDFDYYANSCNGFWEIESLQEMRERSREINQEEARGMMN